MKKLLPLLFVLIITSCSQEESVDLNSINQKLILKNDLVHVLTHHPDGSDSTSESPFTGTAFKEFSGTREIAEKWSYKDGVLHGTYEKFRLDRVSDRYDLLKEKHTYKEGLLDGAYESYHHRLLHQLQFERSYKDGLIQGTASEYYTNGQLKKKHTYKDGVKEGPYEFYTKGGNLIEKVAYKNGEMDGLYLSYHDYFWNSQLKSYTSQLKHKQNFKDGIANGKWETFYGNGQLEKGLNYNEFGEKNGPFEEYWENGNLKGKATYKDGRQIENYVHYYENGEISRKTDSYGNFVCTSPNC